MPGTQITAPPPYNTTCSLPAAQVRSNRCCMCTSIVLFGSVYDELAGMHLIVDDKGVFREDNFHKVFATIMKITTTIMIVQS